MLLKSSPQLVTTEADPLTVREAMQRPEHKEWEQAMSEEYQALIENQTWVMVPLPPGRKAIKNKWVFSTKKDNDGNITRRKARLVVKGCSQRPGIDYKEVFAPVVRYSSILVMKWTLTRWTL